MNSIDGHGHDQNSIDNYAPVQNPHRPGSRAWLPNAIAALIIGVHAIIAGFHPVTAIGGIICGFLAINKYKKDKPLYDSNPMLYEGSFKMLKAGRITGIVGLCLSGFVLLVTIVVMIFAIFMESNRYDPYYDDPYYNEYYNDYDYYDYDY